MWIKTGGFALTTLLFLAALTARLGAQPGGYPDGWSPQQLSNWNSAIDFLESAALYYESQGEAANAQILRESIQTLREAEQGREVTDAQGNTVTEPILYQDPMLAETTGAAGYTESECTDDTFVDVFTPEVGVGTETTTLDGDILATGDVDRIAALAAHESSPEESLDVEARILSALLELG